MSNAATGQTGHSTPAQDIPPALAAVRHLARHQVMGLASVFLLGIAVNQIGPPAETSARTSPASRS